jgi:transcriptional regulator with XRE-family HTH domain
MHVGERIRELRNLAGLTAEQFAVGIGRGSQTLLRWEWGVVSPRLEDLDTIAKKLGTSVADLLVGVTDFAEKSAGHAAKSAD